MPDMLSPSTCPVQLTTTLKFFTIVASFIPYYSTRVPQALPIWTSPIRIPVYLAIKPLTKLIYFISICYCPSIMYVI